MKLKIKLPLLFLLMLLILMFSIGLYLKFVFAVYSPIRTTLLDSRYIALLLPIFAIAGCIFFILIIYIHFRIEKPIRRLNTRLGEVNVVHPLPPLALKRKDEIGELYKHFNKMEHRLQLAHREQTDMIAANELIQRKSAYMVELLNDFSSFTKEKLELESMIAKPVKATELFEDIAFEYEYELAGLDIELTCRHSFTDSIRLMVNEPMIRRVFGNLFSNAVRYGGKNKLKVYMTGYLREHYAYFQIEDNGIGVPDKELSSLFLKFFTVDQSRQIQKGGLGLGLASCKSIIEHHGGEIVAYSSKEASSLDVKISCSRKLQSLELDK
ncbi:HAMP domain-containing sensor histidine kinase [Paenibacillus sonchi]|uniref:HAMP domain-containing sensor histidine kinase n=1 Tax=Paenibacillus sonchi TaxID=373687 RepID=UPI001E4458FF|nr:HAMP domain-containing sensor histidine kinase [Paenibacillus sonchi]MCE3201438.1 HAMP domain-containing histidine kinase [Paenibacillus sonchi]